MDQVLRAGEVQRITGLSRTTLWRQEREGKFPGRRKLGKRSVGWMASEIARWLESRAQVDVTRSTGLLHEP